MRKHLIPLLAGVLAALSLGLAVYALHCARTSRQALEAEILEQSQRIDRLYSKIDALTAQLEASVSGAASPICNFLVESWAADGETVTLTSAYVELQLPDDLTAASARLTLRHNGAEISSATLTLEAAAEGVYRQTLTDTWFLLPTLADDDTLELYLEVELSDGSALSALGITWYCTDGGLYSAVG